MQRLDIIERHLKIFFSLLKSLTQQSSYAQGALGQRDLYIISQVQIAKISTTK